MRLIDTGLTDTQNNIDILEGIRGQLSDGIWENSRRMDAYWRINVVNQDGRLFLDAPPCGVYATMSDSQIVRWWQRKIHAVVKWEQKYWPEVGAFDAKNPAILKLFHGHVPMKDAVAAYRNMGVFAKEVEKEENA